MSNSIVKNIIITLGILFFQVMVLNRLNISQSLLPLMYPVILLSLTRNTNRSLLLLLGFGLGLFVDMFSNTGGAHAVACTVLAFSRQFFLSSMGPMDMGSEQIKPSIINLGLKNYAAFSFFLLAIHHIVFFALEVFSVSNLFDTVIRTLLSLAVSWILIMIYQFTFASKEK